MKKLIVAFAGLLLLNLNASAISSAATANHPIITAQKPTVQAPATVTTDDNIPVYKETGFVHHLVFVDDSHSNIPLTFKDYTSWMFIFGLIVLLVVALLIVVKAQDFIATVERKYGPDTNQHLSLK
ncbi:hypothetical protein ACPPVU_17775 [Mucilaginibacter sp. McL0603]|uniref:hypothetical protein n=1 Tax=Mucilaginibacter sp. McL0603 TaxID=3415670 RepID=UPI003CEF15EE